MNSPEQSPDYQRDQAHRIRSTCSRSVNEIDRICTNEGSEAAWTSWPTMPRNPYRAGTAAHAAWDEGARATFAARGDRDYCPALHP